MVDEKKELVRYQNLLSDRLHDIYRLSLEFGRVLGFIFEEDLKLEGGLAQLSEEDLNQVYQRVHARVLDENDQSQPSEGDYSQLLSNLLLLEHNAPKLYSYFRNINKDKFTSGGDLAIENLLQQSTEKHAAFRCTSLYKSYRIDENDQYKSKMQDYENLKYVQTFKMAIGNATKAKKKYDIDQALK